LAWIRQCRHGSARPPCPRCGSAAVQRWGSFSGRQRHRCRACRRTFSDLTGSPLAGTKQLSRWPAFLAELETGSSLRALAAGVGIHTTTAFRWRHRTLAAAAKLTGPCLRGEIVARIGVIRGMYGLNSSPSAAPRANRIQNWGLALVDRPTHRNPMGFRLFYMGTDRRSLGSVGASEEARQSPLSQRTVWSIEGPRSPLARAGHHFRALQGSARAGPWRAYRAATKVLVGFNQWLRRFRGISTDYAERYIRWHELLSMDRGNRVCAEANRKIRREDGGLRILRWILEEVEGPQSPRTDPGGKTNASSTRPPDPPYPAT
jgi:transposase-like protein